MTETTIFGPPGTGKTTRLIKIVEGHLLQKKDPKKIGFMSFSREAAEEARTRAVASLEIDYKDMLFFRTLHSLADQLV